MSHPWKDPFEVLGLDSNADKKQIKSRFRELAMKYHPDRDPSPSAAAKFAEVKRAADAILKSSRHHPGDPVSAGAAAVRYNWEAGAGVGVNAAEFWQHSQRKTGPLWFTSALIAAGLVLFGGTIWMHYAGLEKEVEHIRSERQRLEATGGSSRRQELLQLVEEERRQAALRKARGEGAAGGAAGSTQQQQQQQQGAAA